MSNEMQLPGANDGNGGIVPAPQQRSVMATAAASREAAEIQAMMVMAAQFPRDEIQATSRILTACARYALAERAMYAYPKGGKVVTGPSIRLAEALAQYWGNIDFGVKELEQRDGESVVQSYAIDLETRTRRCAIFTVKHERHVNLDGGGKEVRPLTDPRDIYEMAANQGARRLRACILAIIPGDVTERAVLEVQKTLAGKNKEPIADRALKIVEAFKEFGVTKHHIEMRIGHKLDSIIETEMVVLRGIYQSLKDGMASREDFFTMAEESAEAAPLQPGRSRTRKPKAGEGVMGGPPGVAEQEKADRTAETKTADVPSPSPVDEQQADMTAANLFDLLEIADTQAKLEEAGGKIKDALPLIGTERHARLVQAYQKQYGKVHKK